MTDNSTLLMQFGKWPVAGHVKTRIAKTMGSERALAIHNELSLAVLENLSSYKLADYEFWFDQVYGVDAPQHKEAGLLISSLNELNVPIKQQEGEDLGDRMFNALNSSLSQYKKAIIVGSDCPTVDDRILGQAVRGLDAHDLVVVPADDGGYVLIGAKKVDPELFSSTRWGQGEVLKQLLENVNVLGLSIAVLDETWDVDEEKDYLKWKAMKSYNAST